MSAVIYGERCTLTQPRGAVVLHLQSYLEPLVIRFGLTIAFPSGGMGVTVTLRVTVVDEVSH